MRKFTTYHVKLYREKRVLTDLKFVFEESLSYGKKILWEVITFEKENVT